MKRPYLCLLCCLSLLLSNCDRVPRESDAEQVTAAPTTPSPATEDESPKNPLELHVKERPSSSSLAPARREETDEIAVDTEAEAAPPVTYRLTYRPKRREVRGEAVAMPPVAPVTPPAAGAADRAALYASFAKAPQIFRISAEADTILACAEGTRIDVPPGVFADSATGQAVTGEVEIRVQEYLSMSDIVFNNLATTSGEALLETAGMVNLRASADGRPLALRPGATLGLAFPRPGAAKPGMQLFTGVALPGHDAANGAAALDWQLASATDTTLTPKQWWERGDARRRRRYRQVYLAADYPGGQSGLSLALHQQLAYTARKGAAQARRPMSVRARERLAWFDSKAPARLRGRLVDVVELGMMIDEKGKISQFTYARGRDRRLIAQVRAAVRKLPQTWLPAICDGTAQAGPVPTLRIYFSRRGQMEVQRFLAPVRGSGCEQEVERDSLAQARVDSAVTVALRARALDRVPWEMTGSFPSTQISSRSYFMRTARLGWHNCDRIQPVALRKLAQLAVDVTSVVATKANEIAQRVKEPAPDFVTLRVEVADADVKVLLRDQRTMLVPNKRQGTQQTFKLPKDTPLTIMAVRMQEGVPQIATRAIVAADATEREFAFRSVSLAELRAEVDQLAPN
jgi:hypothetical protein